VHAGAGWRSIFENKQGSTQSQIARSSLNFWFDHKKETCNLPDVHRETQYETEGVSSHFQPGGFRSMSSPFEPGMSRELTVVSTHEDSARRFYPNVPDVFGTPCLGGLMERVSAELINERLNPGEQSVGISMNLTHTAATPLGMEIRVRAEVIAVEGRKLTFKLEAFDEVEKIGEATHERFIIVADKFNARVAKKAQKG
jgi:predicted thioesterase